MLDELLDTPPQRASEPLILLVDDEIAMQQLGRQLLEREGFRVIVAGNGVEAVDLFRRHRDDIDLVVLDLLMPEMDGGRAYLEMKKIDASVRVFFCSGYSSEDLIDSLLVKEPLRALQKPFRPAEFLRMVRQVLQEP